MPCIYLSLILTVSHLQEIESIQYNEKDYEGLPFEFHGGFVGYLGYVDFLS